MLVRVCMCLCVCVCECVSVCDVLNACVYVCAFECKCVSESEEEVKSNFIVFLLSLPISLLFPLPPFLPTPARFLLLFTSNKF